MDHLATSEERQDRWYCRSIWPRSLPVRRADDWKDLLRVPPQGGQGEPYDYDFCYSVPIEWISNHPETPNGSPPDLLARILELHGFLVVSKVLSQEECGEALELAWDWMEAASAAECHVQSQQSDCCDNNGSASNKSQRVDRKDPVTHSKAGTAFFPRTCEAGMMPFYGAGHSSLAWKIRSHPHVVKVFASLQQLQGRLLSSLDGMVLWTAQQLQHQLTDAGWFHVDQNPKRKPYRASVQSLVNLIQVTLKTGGNALVVQSHREFANQHFVCQGTNSTISPDDDSRTQEPSESVRDFYAERLKEVDGDDWLEIDPNDDALLHPSRVVSLLLDAGDMLLWDSRIVHCSYPPRPDEDGEKGAGAANEAGIKGFLRAATLISMMPESQVSQDVKLARKEAIQSSRTLTHWVDKAAPLGEERAEDVALEQACVDFMKERQRKGDTEMVLYEWEDLNEEQQGQVL